MDQLKIGVLTFHRCINYGSYWQARCLAEGLAARGHEVNILDHESGRVNFSEWKCAYQPTLPTVGPSSDMKLYGEKIRSFFRAFESLPLSPRFRLHQPDEMEEYDVVVVGSDEVWNLCHPWYGGCPLFFGEGIRARRFISFAASFGNYDASLRLEERWAKKLQNFAHISVRDENSHRVIEEAVGIKPPLVLDPCLQFPAEPEERAGFQYTHPYIAVYGHNFSTYFIEQIKMYAADRALPLISIGYRNDWADEQWINADPHEFAQFIQRAGAVATNFFHGCVFALRYTKPFVCESSPYRENKLRGLMNKTGAAQHLVTSDTPYHEFSTCLDNVLSGSISDRLDELRKESNAFLDVSLDLTNPTTYDRAVLTS